MKTIEELTKDECQEFLTENFEGSVEFSKLIFDPNFADDESYGIEYTIVPENKKYIVSFSNPDLLIWLYKHDFDMIRPLRQLAVDYTEIDETNSVLFEYAMNINRVMNDYSNANVVNERAVLQELGPLFAEEINKIKELQKELISKL
jgi:hypothetical protein